MVTTNIRWTAAKKIRDLARAHATITNDDVVQTAYPGDAAGPDAMWLDPEIEGVVDIPVLVAGRKERSDDFTLTWHCRSQGYPDQETAITAVQALMGVLEDVLANEPRLADLDGINEASVSVEKGPSAFDISGAGWVGYGSVDILIESRLL